MVTKRMAGIALVGLGLLIVVATIAVDLAGVGKWRGFGPSQRAAVAVGLAVLLAGAAMIPLGDRPA